MTPVLISQGFQRAFVDTDGPMFSASASIRRMTCERLLARARQSGWTVVHSFLDTEPLRAAGEEAIHGFSPLPSESWFWQPAHSAFTSPAFERFIVPHFVSPMFLMSFAGFPAISATLTAALDKHLAMHVVTDAVADVGRFGVEERERLKSIEALAKSCECAVTSDELATLSPAELVPAFHRLAPAPQLLSQSGR
jgi:hypothetical protein